MAAQGLQDSAITILVDACWQLRGLMGGAVEDDGYGGGVSDKNKAKASRRAGEVSAKAPEI